MSEILIQTMFAIVCMMGITGVEISKKAKCVKQNGIFEKFENTKNLIYTMYAMSEMLI